VPHHAFFIYEVHHHSRKQTEYDLKVRWGAGVTAMAVMVCVGVDEEGFSPDYSRSRASLMNRGNVILSGRSKCAGC
jgi:hypothetical protein